MIMDYTETYINSGDKTPAFVVRNSDGASIPIDPNNIDYQTYLKWKAKPANIPATDVVNPVSLVGLTR